MNRDGFQLDLQSVFLIKIVRIQSWMILNQIDLFLDYFPGIGNYFIWARLCRYVYTQINEKALLLQWIFNL